MNLKKKFFLIVIWLFILSILINILYGFFFEDDYEKVKNALKFNFRYYTRKVISTTLEYKDFYKDDIKNVVSKNNMSIELVDINYNESSGDLDLNFKFFTNDKQILDNDIGCVLRIYDNENIFCNSILGNATSENTRYLLDENRYKNLNSSNMDIYNNFEIIDSDTEENKNAEVNLKIKNNYRNILNIAFLDFSYKTVEEFFRHRAIEPLGEFRFIIEF